MFLIIDEFDNIWCSAYFSEELATQFEYGHIAVVIDITDPGKPKEARYVTEEELSWIPIKEV